ncbi:tyrosine-type recombinase/integrase [Cellulomonas sp. P24]|uniref:tyrosine-type recombinase/integrase n=1 Tax=Cellulomonas sp. P24 TaxID=2885206 RepID=UPI00216AC86B|nr:tyrosine-type recombinase/integrase [Cellulomonas sp. P24]MCR6491706.1 tyrosine-type recombinase/integrase [Cellulomonas sp. P24]
MPPPSPTPDLRDLLPSWVLSMRAERKSPATIEQYTRGVRMYLDYCADVGCPAVLTKANAQGFMAHLLDEGREATTVRARQLALQRFAAYLLDEGEIPADPLAGLRAPKIDTKIVQPLTEPQLRDLLAACKGSTFADLRDQALVRFMVETGARAGEVVAIELADVDLLAGMAVIRRGKGGKGRVVPFGPQTARALDKYIRKARRSHPLADTPALWLGGQSKTFGYDALFKGLRARAAAAGITGFHPHLLRHTAAHRWLAAGGSEGGLMAVAGWSKPDMLMRYSRARASERAATEARDLNLGDI